jgi:hypothetical protein
MSLQQMFLVLVQTIGPLVSMDNVTLNNAKSGGGFCYAYCKIDYDGSVYLSDNAGSYGGASQVWLDSIDPEEVWVSRTSTGDALFVDDIGAGRTQITGDLVTGLRENSGSVTGSGTFSFWNAASGGNLLDTATYSLTAEKT